MTDLVDFLHPTTVLPRARGGSRKCVLSELSEAAAVQAGLASSTVFEAVMERERLGSTGVGEGVAIPHARVKGLSTIVGAFARLDEGVDFDALDQHPCDLVFMLLAPEHADADHLRALAKVSRVMRQDDVRKALRQAHSVDAILSVFQGPRPESDAA